MNIGKIFGLFLLVVVVFGCTTKNKESIVKPYNPQSPDLAFLKEILKEKRIVALGESSHGFGSLYGLKEKLVQYLHTKLGYEVLIMEAGFGDIGLGWQNIESTHALQLRNGTLHGSSNCDQMLPMFEYLKAKSETENPLEFAGIDPQVSGKGFKFKLMYVIQRLEPKIIQDSIESGLLDYYVMFQQRDDSEAWHHHKNKFLSAMELAQSILIEAEEDIQELELATAKEMTILNRSLEQLIASVDYKFGEVFTRGLPIRDSLMAENVYYLLDEIYPDKKVIIWGHNGHLQNSSIEGNDVKWLGHYLKEKYKENYYSLGMFVKKGDIYLRQEKRNSPFDLRDDSFIEGKLDKLYGKNVFVDLPDYDKNSNSWEHRRHYGYEIESGGKVTFVPSKRFDGVMLLGETKAPTFEIKLREYENAKG